MMNSNSSDINFYCSNIRDEEQCWSQFLHFGSSFVDVESSVGVALICLVLFFTPFVDIFTPIMHK